MWPFNGKNQEKNRFLNTQKRGEIGGGDAMLKAFYGDLLPDNKTKGEISVSPRVLQAIPPVLRALKLFRDTSMAIRASATSGSYGEQKALRGSHPFVQLLEYGPSPAMGWPEFVGNMFFYAALHGQWPAFIDRDERGRTVNIRIMQPDESYDVVLEDANRQVDMIQLNTTTGVSMYKQEDVIMFKFFPNADPFWAINPSRDIKEAFQFIRYTHRVGLEYWRDGNIFDMYLQFNSKSNPDTLERVRKSFLQRIMTRFSMPIMEYGTELKQVPKTSFVDADYMKTLEYLVTQVGQIFGIPEHLLGNLRHATFSNIEQQFFEFGKLAMAPSLRNFEAEVSRKVFWYERDKLNKLNMHDEEFFVGDTDSLAKLIQNLFMTGSINQDEIRNKYLRMSKLPNKQGEKYYVPGHMGSGMQDSLGGADNSPRLNNQKPITDNKNPTDNGK